MPFLKLTSWIDVSGVLPNTNARFLHGLLANDVHIEPGYVCPAADMTFNDGAKLNTASGVAFGAGAVFWDTLYIYVSTGVDTSTGHMVAFRDAHPRPFARTWEVDDQ